jgi:phenylacetate-coenzyme A ligase PaaK-like adenylate-forming protein
VPALRARIKSALALTPEITVLKPGELPRPPGKSVRVVDRRPR